MERECWICSSYTIIIAPGPAATLDQVSSTNHRDAEIWGWCANYEAAWARHKLQKCSSQVCIVKMFEPGTNCENAWAGCKTRSCLALTLPGIVLGMVKNRLRNMHNIPYPQHSDYNWKVLHWQGQSKLTSAIAWDISTQDSTWQPSEFAEVVAVRFSLDILVTGECELLRRSCSNPLWQIVLQTSPAWSSACHRWCSAQVDSAIASLSCDWAMEALVLHAAHRS